MAFVESTHSGYEANCALAEKEFSSVFPQRFYIVEDLSLRSGRRSGAERGG